VKGFRRRKRRFIDADFQSRLILRFVGVIVLSTVLFSIGFLAFYWVSFIAGDNLFKEFLVVYKQIETVDDVDIGGRSVQQRSYTVEAQPETSRWRLILPPLMFNNLLIAIVLSFFAVWYSHRIAGPVYRITSDVRSALLGRRGVRVHLRRKDELRELAAQINRLLEELDAAEGEDEWTHGRLVDEGGSGSGSEPD
jgi:hypothetical protein